MDAGETVEQGPEAFVNRYELAITASAEVVRAADVKSEPEENEGDS